MKPQFRVLITLLIFKSALLSEYKSILSSTFEALIIYCNEMKKIPEMKANALKSSDFLENIILNNRQNCCSLEIPNTSFTYFNSCIQNDFTIDKTNLINLSNKTNINEKCIQITFNLFCEYNIQNKTNIWDQFINSCVNFVESNLFSQGQPLRTYSSKDILMRSFESEKLELRCNIEGFPLPDIQWLRNNQLINDLINNSINFNIELNIEIKNEFQSVCKSIAILEIPLKSRFIFGNYSCFANNSFGNIFETFVIEEKTLLDLRKRLKIKRFNITGFAIGMCPPMFISFYIIIKLGYRSRYAQERTDENGNEEPFFVSN